MKATGMTRNIDHLGRITLPVELRRMFGIEIKDSIEIFIDDGLIILKKYESQLSCAVTGEASYDNLSLAGGKVILSEESAKQLYKEIKDDLNL